MYIVEELKVIRECSLKNKDPLLAWHHSNKDVDISILGRPDGAPPQWSEAGWFLWVLNQPEIHRPYLKKKVWYWSLFLPNVPSTHLLVQRCAVNKAKLRHSSQRGSEGRSRRQSTAPADLFPFRNVFLPRIWTGWSTSGLCWYLLRTLSGSKCESLIELSQDQHPGSELQWARVLFLFLTWLPFRNKNSHMLACSWNS